MSVEYLSLKEYPPFKWLGYTLEHWASDVRLRINVVKYGVERQKLLATKANLDQFKSQEMKMADALREAMDYLN